MIIGNHGISAIVSKEGQLLFKGCSGRLKGITNDIEYTLIPTKENTQFMSVCEYNPNKIVALGCDGSLWELRDINTFGHYSSLYELRELLDIDPIRCASDLMIKNKGEHKFTSITRGKGFYIAIDDKGNAWERTQVFDSDPICFPKQIVNLNNITMVAAGSFHMIFYDEYDNLWGKGGNTWGQLMLDFNNCQSITVPCKLATITPPAIQIACTSQSSIIVNMEGVMTCFGVINIMEIERWRREPRINFTKMKVSQVWCSENRIVFNDYDGNFWVYGSNLYRLLLWDVSDEDITIPTRLLVPFPPITQILLEKHDTWLVCEGNITTRNCLGTVTTSAINADIPWPMNSSDLLLEPVKNFKRIPSAASYSRDKS